MKRKLSLDLNELRVETFGTDVAGAPRGTVRGLADSDCCTISCNGTCGAAPDSTWLKYARTQTNCPQCCV
jgi:hypothetical protein